MITETCHHLQSGATITQIYTHGKSLAQQGCFRVIATGLLASAIECSLFVVIFTPPPNGV